MAYKVNYPKSAVAAFLKERFPETDWEPVITIMPPIIWRHRWEELSQKYGLPYSKRYVQNLDSEGQGPASFM